MTPACRVLVLDDHDRLRRNIVALLADEGFAMLEADSGEAALRLIAEQAVDVAIVDVRLPGISGNDFILAAHTRAPRLRYLIHTGSVDYQLPAALHRIGLRDTHVFMKPIADPALLFDAIRALVAERDAGSAR